MLSMSLELVTESNTDLLSMRHQMVNNEMSQAQSMEKTTKNFILMTLCFGPYDQYC